MTGIGQRLGSDPDIHRERSAARLILKTYAGLNARGEHLLQPLMAGASPRQWEHYPSDDAIDSLSGFQWFYHSHSPDDRPGCTEHGHIHLFARRGRWAGRLRGKAEQAFAALTGDTGTAVRTRHLIGIGLSAKGIPVSLFTVNSWVTGDLMLSAPTTERLLACLALDTSFSHIDAAIRATIHLCAPEIRELMIERDTRLRANPRRDKLRDESMEVLSEVKIELDRKLVRHFD